jgi:ribosome-binding factor A
MSVRIDRLGNTILEVLSKIIFDEVKNPIIRNIVLTSCTVTNDLSFAKVYFTCMNEDKDKVMEELEEAKGFLRGKLSENIDIRHTPELVFVYDNSIEYGMNIERIIKEIHEKDEDNQ